jgi:hypothetical protein
MKAPFQINGFIKAPKLAAKGKTYRGRFVCQGVQWTGAGQELMATFTITAQEIADAADNGLLWTDQDVQRGIKPDVSPTPPRELSLADGYPDPKKYVFDADNADDMVQKLLQGEKLFLNPLVWNLRPGHFEAYPDEQDASLSIYSGRIYLPDSHHRQQAIVKAIKIWRTATREYPRFSGEREFKIELYFFSREDEGNYFFDKNQRPKPTAKSKAYDLTTLDDLSLLAKKVIENSKNLTDNVNRVTDKLVAKNPQVITLSTLREMMKSFASEDALDSSELDGIAAVAAQFYDLLAEVRPELGRISAPERRNVREGFLVDSAVMMHGYAAVMRDYNDDLAKMGSRKTVEEWRSRLKRLAPERRYKFEKWSGDLFEKENPLWRELGIVKPGAGGTRLTVLNTGSARSQCGRVLRQLLSLKSPQADLRFLVKN